MPRAESLDTHSATCAYTRVTLAAMRRWRQRRRCINYTRARARAEGRGGRNYLELSASRKQHVIYIFNDRRRTRAEGASATGERENETDKSFIKEKGGRDGRVDGCGALLSVSCKAGVSEPLSGAMYFTTR